MSANEFVESFAENEIANLRADIDCFDCCAVESVSEPDGSVSCSSS